MLSFKMPRPLDKEKHEILQQYWNGGMTAASTANTPLIQKAADEVGVDFRMVKNWIGNERKRRGQAGKRGPQVKREEELIPCKRRKKSGFNVFKSKFLRSKGKDLQSMGKNMAEIQKIANEVYRQLTEDEKREFVEDAEVQNVNPSEKMINKNAVIKRLRGDLHDIIGRLDSLGCPSVWIGYISDSPEKVFSPAMAFLGEDSTFNDYVSSVLINKMAKDKMQKTVANLQDENDVEAKGDEVESSEGKESTPVKAAPDKPSKGQELAEQEEDCSLSSHGEEAEEQQETEEEVGKHETPQQHVLFHQVEIHEQNGEAVTAAAQLLQSSGTRQLTVYNAADGQQYAILLQEQQQLPSVTVGEVVAEMLNPGNPITTSNLTPHASVPVTKHPED